MTCDEFSTAFAAYTRGALDDAAATALEQHAAGCDACARRMEQLPLLSVTTFAPALPDSIRPATLRAVAARRTIAVRRRWLGAVTVAAAAVLAVLSLTRGPDRTPTGTVAIAPDTAPADTLSPTAIATLRARPDFDALDAAERELQAALRTTPDDVQLRAFLASVAQQRDALRRRVEAART